MRDNDFTPKIEILQQRLSELQRCATENPAQLASALPETFRELLNVLEELRESEEKYCILSDITERARAEEALRESEDRYRRITEAVTDYIYTVRVEGGQAVETTHGPACVAVTGYTSEEFAADPYLWLSMVDERDRAAVLEQAQRVLTGEAIGPLEHRIIRKDGAQRWVRNTPVPHWDPQGKLLSYDGLIRDITERKRAEVALRRRNTELEALYKTSLEINAQPDLSTLLHTIVERAVELLGARMGGLYLMRPDGQTLELVVSYNLPGDYAGVTLRLGEGLSGQIAQTGEPMMIEDYRHWEGRALIYADGPFRRVLGVPLKVGGKVIGVINITDDKQTGPFSEDEVRLVSLFADQAAIAVENARLYETSQRELAERVRAEEALRESEARYRSLFEDMPISLWEEDLSEIKKYIDTLRAADVSDLRAYFNDHPEAVIHCAGLIKVLEVNQVTLELYKADTKEGLTEGLEASRSYGPFEKTQYKPFRDELIARAEGRTHFESEESQYDLAGDRFYALVRTSVAPGYEDTWAKVFVSVMDITKRVQMEEALRESEHKFRSIVEQSADGIVLADEQGTIIEWNQGQEQITGLKRTEALGKPIWDVLHRTYPEEQQTPAVYARLKASTLEFLRTGQVSWMNRLTETEIRRSDGTRRSVQAIMFPIKTNKGFMPGSISRDITERVRAEEEIRWRAETLAALHETALDLAAQRALPDLLRAIVARAVDLLKAKEGGLLFYRPATDDLERVLAYNFDPSSVRAVIRRGEGLAGKILESGQPLVVADYNSWEGRIEQFEKNVAIVGVPIFWSDRLLGVLDVADTLPRTFSPADVALLERFTPLAAAALENNRLMRDLEQQMDKLKQAQAQLVQAAKLAAVGELAAGVAHELNNPLTSVLGFAELLLRSLALDAPSRHDVETIAREARRARDIVRSLLDFARQTKPLREPTDVNQVLQQTLALIRQHLEKSGVVIAEEYAPEIGLVSLDGGRMKQVFLNLITNAAQAMPGGGTLMVRTVRVGDEVAVSMADTGAGIPPEVQERIFDPFFSTKPSGTGLGLSVSLGIVEEHGGRITVESRVGQGSTFTVWLPGEVKDGR